MSAIAAVRAGPLKVSERDFLRAVCDYATLRRWRQYHTFDSRRSVYGFPDLILIRDGVCVALELKSEKGKTTEAQRDWVDELDAVAGITARIVRPSDWDEIVSLLR